MRNYPNRFPRHGEIIQKKSLGQVFLNTDWPVKKMVEQLVQFDIKRVIEIGPGNGILTMALAEAGIHVTAVEKDDRFAERLKDLVKEDPRRMIEVENIDITKFDLSTWIKKGGGAKSAVERLHQPDIANLYDRRFVIVRPDGHVAWRGEHIPADVSSDLRKFVGKEPE